jgi:hypothetical protein
MSGIGTWVAAWFVSASGSAVGSFAIWFGIFHYDLEDHWRLWKVKQGRKREEAEFRRSNKDVAAHQQLMDEERRREHDREWPL